MAPIQEEIGDLEAKEEDEEGAVDDGDEVTQEEQDPVDIDRKPVWEELQNKMEDLAVRVARHFEDGNDNRNWQPPMVAQPLQPTKDEWLRHQLTHTRRTQRGADIATQPGL